MGRAIRLTLVVLAVGAVAARAADVDLGASAARWERDSLRRLVSDLSLEHGLDPRLMDALVRAESDYDPKAVSRKGAMGLMQLMPDTARRLAVDDPFDPEDNVRGGMREFQRLLDRYSGDVVLALAAYNAGEGAVASYGGVPPFQETVGYVRRILTMYTGRPYTLSTARRSAPVRLVRDSASGTVVITNVAGKAAPSASRPVVLGGGFGQTSR